jgi:cell division septum initiation protein DivIVA
VTEHTESVTAQSDRRFRGYDRAAVDAHVERARALLARRERELAEARGQLDDLQRELGVARHEAADANDAAARAAASARVFDHIVRLARETAAGILDDARRRASEDPMPAVPVPVVAALAQPADVSGARDEVVDDEDGLFAEPLPKRVTFNHSAAMELFDDETADDKWESFTESEAGKAFFADESVDERSRRWMLAG